MDEVVVVESVQRLWATIPHDEVVEKDDTYTLAFELAALQWVLRLTVGSRGGLIASLWVLDPAQKVLVDQLVHGGRFDPEDMAARLLFDFGVFREVRTEVRVGAPRRETCTKCLTTWRAGLDTLQPGVSHRSRVEFLTSRGQYSVPTLSGGSVRGSGRGRRR